MILNNIKKITFFTIISLVSVLFFFCYASYNVCADDAYVTSLDELKEAISNDSVQTIYLNSDLDFPSNSSSNIPINRNIIIDGQGHLVTNEGFSSSNYGLYFKGNNIEITLKNIKFGDATTKKSFSNYWGIAYGNGSNQNLNLENVSYFSNYYGQPFHLQDKTNTITFDGINTFEQDPGPYTQEWAEASNFVFKKNSHTTINHNSSDPAAGGFIWSTSDLNFNLEDNASVYISTNHYFSWSDSLNNNVRLGENSNLSIQDTVYPLTRYNKNYNFVVGANSNLNLYTARSSGSGDFSGSFKFGNNSSGKFKTGSKAFFNNASGINFELDNPKLISFESLDKDASSINPIGLNGKSNINFSAFTQNSSGYGIFTDDKQIDIQKSPDSWSVSNNEITRENTDFSKENKVKLNDAKSIKIEKLENLIFDGNAGNPAVQVRAVVPDSIVEFNTLNLTIPSKINYLFKGWSLTKDDFNTQVDKMKVPIDGATVYALWVPNNAQIKSIDDFNFGSHVINNTNTYDAESTLIIEDNLNSEQKKGWKLTVNYDPRDESTKKWIDEKLNLNLTPKSEQAFILVSNPFNIGIQPHIIAQVDNESQKGDQTEEVIKLNPKIIPNGFIKAGAYHATLLWDIENSPN